MDVRASINPNLSLQALKDYDLVQKAITGNERAYALLLERYRGSIFQLMMKMVNNRTEADDLTMEAFGKAFNKLPMYAPTYAFSTWLFKIAINNCIDHVRKKRLPLVQVGDTFGNATLDQVQMARSSGATPEEEMIRQQRLDMMQHLLTRLNPKYRMMIQLRFYDELSYEEIAQEMQIPLGTVKAQLFRAKELLYQMLQSPAAKAYFERTSRFEVAAAPGESA